MKIEELENAPQWLLEADTKNANVGMINGRVHWYDGIWEGGHWRGGTWHNGEWRDGTWHYGMWFGGEWKGGYRFTETDPTHL